MPSTCRLSACALLYGYTSVYPWMCCVYDAHYYPSFSVHTVYFITFYVHILFQCFSKLLPEVAFALESSTGENPTIKMCYLAQMRWKSGCQPNLKMMTQGSSIHATEHVWFKWRLIRPNWNWEEEHIGRSIKIGSHKLCQCNYNSHVPTFSLQVQRVSNPDRDKIIPWSSMLLM